MFSNVNQLITINGKFIGNFVGVYRIICRKKHFRTLFSLPQIAISMSSTIEGEPFNFRKALILTKFSRYEFEHRRNPDWSEEQLKINVSVLNNV